MNNVRFWDHGDSRKAYDKPRWLNKEDCRNGIWTEVRTAQVPVPRCIVLGTRNQARGFIFEPHPVEVEHQLVRHENPPHNRFILRHDLDLVFLERLRGIVYPIFSDGEPVTVTSSREVKLISKNPCGRAGSLTTIECNRV